MVVTYNNAPGAYNQLVPVTRAKYTQNWPAYNAAQIQEQELFAQLLRELCDTVPQPRHSMGRPRLPLSDMVYTGALKVYSLMSGRRAMGDIRHAEQMKQIDLTPCFTSIQGYMRKPGMTDILTGLIQASAEPLKSVEVDFAVDSSGFGTNSYHRWFDHKWGKQRSSAQWVKAHIACGVKTNIITAAHITMNNAYDANFMAGLVQDTAKNFNIREVSGDKAYSMAANFRAVADVGGTAYIPFKSNARPVAKLTRNREPLWTKAYYFYHYHQEEFKAHYHKRSNVETTFSMVKAKFGASVRSKTSTGQINEVLLKFLCHNIVVLIQSMYELDLVQEFRTKGLIN